MAMTDEWNESLRCPTCGKTGIASLSQDNDDAPTVQSVPDGFKVVATQYGPDFLCGAAFLPVSNPHEVVARMQMTTISPRSALGNNTVCAQFKDTRLDGNDISARQPLVICWTFHPRAPPKGSAWRLP